MHHHVFVDRQSAGDALVEAAAAGLSVIVKESVANGRLLRPVDMKQSMCTPQFSGASLTVAAKALVWPLSTLLMGALY